MKEYEELFREYFDQAEYRGVPIRPSSKVTWNQGNCIGEPPNDPTCKGGYFCNVSVREWQCKT